MAFFKSNSHRQPSGFQMLMSYIVLAFWAFIVLFPLYWLVITSFKLPFQVNEGPFYLPFIDYQPSLHAWRYVFVDVWSDTVRPYVNTIIIALVSTVLAVVFGATAAYGLTRFEYKPRLYGIFAFVLFVAGGIVAIRFV